MIGGPNGSGKTTLLKWLGDRFQLGHALNPDEIDRLLQVTGQIEFEPWGLHVKAEELTDFLKTHALAPSVQNQEFDVQNNVLVIRGAYASGYFSAVLSDFMRRQWLRAGENFTFETVMSNADKVELLRTAQSTGYRTYLYYICTDSPLINQERVSARVSLGGHDVPAEKVQSRYQRSLSLLMDAISVSDRAYLLDNSGKSHRLVAEFEKRALKLMTKDPPTWLINAVLEKMNFDDESSAT